MLKINMDQIPIRAVPNVYLNNNVYICSGSQSPLPFLSREVPHSYRPWEKHETEVQEVHFSNTTILLRLCAMRTDAIRKHIIYRENKLKNDVMLFFLSCVFYVFPMNILFMSQIYIYGLGVLDRIDK